MRKIDARTATRIFDELVLAINGLNDKSIAVVDDKSYNNYILNDGSYFEDSDVNAYITLADDTYIEIFGDYDSDFVESIDKQISKVNNDNFDNCCLISITINNKITNCENDESKKKLIASTIYKTLSRFLLDGLSSIDDDSLWIVDTDYVDKDIMPQNLAYISSI